MILNIVTKTPNRILDDLQFFWSSDWDINYLGEVAEGIHEYSLVPKIEGESILSVENLLELGCASWNIRIR